MVVGYPRTGSWEVKLIGGDILNRNPIMLSLYNAFYVIDPANVKIYSLGDVSPFGEGKPDVG